MNISGDTPGVDYVAYFTKQLPKDLAAMAALRDELAVRQGALSAAEAALADRDAAAKVLAKLGERRVVKRCNRLLILAVDVRQLVAQGLDIADHGEEGYYHN